MREDTECGEGFQAREVAEVKFTSQWETFFFLSFFFIFLRAVKITFNLFQICDEQQGRRLDKLRTIRKHQRYILYCQNFINTFFPDFLIES